jgi:hypothetical protein
MLFTKYFEPFNPDSSDENATNTIERRGFVGDFFIASAMAINPATPEH